MAVSAPPDYNALLDSARAVDKPLLLYFTGVASVNSRKMESPVLKHPSCAQLIQLGFVFVPIYVDDRTPLPEADRPLNERTGLPHTTIGSVGSELQISLTQTGSQPFFFIVDGDGYEYGSSYYEPEREAFKRFLAMASLEYLERHDPAFQPSE